MIKILILVLLSHATNVAYADDKWPTKVAEVGCTFEYKVIYGGDEPKIVEVIDVLPFPEMRIETNRHRNRDPNIKSMAELLAAASGEKPENIKRGSTKNLFCDCFDFEGLDNLFPLSVGKRLVFKDGENGKYGNQIIEVLKFRKSTYFADTNEYLIQYKREYLPSYFTRFGPRYRMWWNVELGFYTESETPLHLEAQKLTSTNCAPDRS